MPPALVGFLGALVASLVLLGASWYLLEAQVLEFMGYVYALFKMLMMKLGQLTFAGVLKYLGAQAARFFTIEWWKYYVIKFLKQSILPVLMSTLLGRYFATFLAWCGKQTRVRWKIFKRWYGKQHVAVQVLLWLLSGILSIVVSIWLIGLGVLAFAVSLPAWLVRLLASGFMKLWLVLQRIVFRTLMFFFTTFGWKQLERWANERRLQAILRLKQDFTEKKELVTKRVVHTVKAKGKAVLRKVGVVKPPAVGAKNTGPDAAE